MKEKIAILGGGPMGLGVAYRLIKDGYKPVIYEADDRLGGMTATFDFSGLIIERFYHFHCISDYAFLDILKELKIEHKMNWTETKMGYWYDNKLQPWGNPQALLSFKGLSFVAKFRYALHAFLSTKRKDWKKLDKINALDWIMTWVGKEAYEILWKKLFDYKFYHFSKDISAAWIWSRIRRVGNSRYNIFREKLGYLEGGSNTLLNSLENFIKSNGGEIHLSSPVEKVQFNGDNVQGLIINNNLIKFNKVISTVPLPYVPRIFPDLPHSVLSKYKSVNNIAVVCVIVKLNKKVTNNFWLNVVDPEMDIPGIVEYSNLRPMDNHLVYVPFYMPGEHEKFKDDDSIFIEKVKKYLFKINKSLSNENIVDIRASRYRHAQPICETNFLSKLPPIESQIKGLWIADTSYYYPEDRGISESIEFGSKMAKMATKY